MTEPRSSQVPPTNNPPKPTPKPSASPVPPASGPLAALEAKLYEWLVYKAPFQLPVGLTDFIVRAGPWITLALAIILLFIMFGLLGLLFWAGSIVTVSAVYSGQAAVNMTAAWISLIILIAQVVVMFVSIPMLLKRQRKGWLLLFYVTLINLAYGIVSSLAHGAFGLGSLVWALISAAIGLYVLFQIRHHYTH